MRRWKDAKIDENLTSKKFFRNLGSYFVLTAALGAMTFFGVCDPSTSSLSIPTGTALSVDGEDITMTAFQRAYLETYNRYQSQAGDDFSPQTIQLANRVADQLVDQLLAAQVASSAGLYVPRDEIIDEIHEIEGFRDEDGRFSGERFSNYLRSQRYTEFEFSEYVKRFLLAQKYREFIRDAFPVSKGELKEMYLLQETKIAFDTIKIAPSNITLNISDEELSTFLESDAGKKRIERSYQDNVSEYQQEKKVGAEHILITYEGATNAVGKGAKRPKAEAEKLAKELQATLSKNPSAFDKTVVANSDDPKAKDNKGSLGFFTKGTIAPELEAAAFNMKKGNISDVIATKFGFHIVRVSKVQEAKNTTLDQVKETIARELLRKDKAPGRLNEVAKEVLAQVTTGKEPSNPKFSWKKANEFSLATNFLPELGADETARNAVLGLQEAGSIHPEVLSVNGNKFIVRLRYRKQPDNNTPIQDEEVMENLRSRVQNMGAFSLMAATQKHAKENLEERKKIWINQELAAFDARYGQEQ